MIVAAQPVGLDAQFAFGLSGVALMLAIQTLRLKGVWLHVFLAVAAAIVFRYMWWRVTQTLPPVSQPVDFGFGLLLFLAEAYSVTMLALSFFFVADPVDRPHAPLAGDPDTWPTVDVFVPSYNEDLDIVGTTLAAAKNLDYPTSRLNIYLLDDGGTDQKCGDSDPEKAAEAQARRRQFEAYCAELGVRYLTRAQNDHAKAGNMNAAMRHTSGDLILVLDADHAPARDFLQRTIGHFQRDPRLFLVQTPHFFLNPDPVERNLQTFQRMPSENEMFYVVTQKGLDKWNAAYFCGSGAVLSRRALEETNGFSGSSITEDCETALELHARGWNSLYVDRPMIAGLQPETFVSFIGQRSRWCQGMLQILINQRPFARRGLSVAQRLAYTFSPLFWLFPLSRLIFMIAPALYVFLDLSIYVASIQEFVAYTAFFLISNVLVQNRVFGTVRWPWVSEVYEYVQSFHLTKAIVSVVLKPNAPTFKVTAKGETLERDHVSALAWPLFAFFGFLVATTAWAAYRLSLEGTANELLVVVTAWSVFNLVIGGIGLGVVRERRERRRHYRVDVERCARVEAELDGKRMQWPVRVADCGIGGVKVRASGTLPWSRLRERTLTLSLLSDRDETIAYPLKVRPAWSGSDAGGAAYGFTFEALTANDRRVVAALLYPSSQALDAIRSRRHTGRSIVRGTGDALGMALGHGFRALRGSPELVRDLRGVK